MPDARRGGLQFKKCVGSTKEKNGPGDGRGAVGAIFFRVRECFIDKIPGGCPRTYGIYMATIVKCNLNEYW